MLKINKEQPERKLETIKNSSVSMSSVNLADCNNIQVKIGSISLCFSKTKTYETNQKSQAWVGKNNSCHTQLMVTQYKNIIWGFSTSTRGCMRFTIKNGLTKIYTCPLKMSGPAFILQKKAAAPTRKVADVSEYRVAVPYNQGFLDLCEKTVDELIAYTENCVLYFNTTLDNTGITDVVVSVSEYREVSYASSADSNDNYSNILYNYETMQPEAYELTSLRDETESNAVYFYTAQGYYGNSTNYVPYHWAVTGYGDVFDIYNTITIYSVSAIQPDPEFRPEYTFCHELGHQVGFQHDDSGTMYDTQLHESLINNGHSEYVPGTINLTGTVMSYASTIVPFFSNLTYYYDNSDILMGADNANNYLYGTELTAHGFDRFTWKSKLFEMKDYPTLKFPYEYDEAAGTWNRIGNFDYRELALGSEFDLLEGTVPFSPVGENVTATNVGDNVDTNTSGVYTIILKLKDDSQRVNYKYGYIRVS